MCTRLMHRVCSLKSRAVGRSPNYRRRGTLLRSKWRSSETDLSRYLLWRAVQHIAGVVGQLLAAVGSGSGTVQNDDSIAENHDFFPACPPGKIVIGVGEFMSARSLIKRAPEHESDLHRRQAAGAVGKYHLARYRI